jgi:predicted RNA-binding Zn-ribbon protein involved in translation (DUF1610 family)
MIPQETIDQVRRLLGEGELSQRKIAELTGVSRGTVNAIALGKRPECQASEERRNVVVRPGGVPVRCPGCGGMVLMPCVACRVRAIRRQQRLAPREPRRGAQQRKDILRQEWEPLEPCELAVSTGET